MTIEALAEITNLSNQHIGHIERGHRKPSLDTITKVSEILNVSLDYLMFGDIENRGIEKYELESLISRCTKKQIDFTIEFIRLMLKQSE